MKAELIDHMGGDLMVVNAARVSFDKESEWEITGRECVQVDEQSRTVTFQDKLELKDKDKKLINYLAKHGHWTPFGHPQIAIRETVPIFVARQRFKHMIGFVYNEVSRRYVDDEPEFFVPDEWRGRPENAKQGSDGKVRFGRTYYPGWGAFKVPEYYEQMLEQCKSCYEAMLEEGVAPEQARMVLPQSMYTSYYVTGSLAAWARAYKLRIDTHAQKEIQDLAKQWGEIIAPLFPVSWEALTNE